VCWRYYRSVGISPTYINKFYDILDEFVLIFAFVIHRPVLLRRSQPRVAKIRLLASPWSVCPSVSPHVNARERLNRIYRYWEVVLRYVDTYQFWLKSGNSNEHFTFLPAEVTGCGIPNTTLLTIVILVEWLTLVSMFTLFFFLTIKKRNLFIIKHVHVICDMLLCVARLDILLSVRHSCVFWNTRYDIAVYCITCLTDNRMRNWGCALQVYGNQSLCGRSHTFIL
jgi:hypothetical protein